MLAPWSVVAYVCCAKGWPLSLSLLRSLASLLLESMLAVPLCGLVALKYSSYRKDMLGSSLSFINFLLKNIVDFLAFS